MIKNYSNFKININENDLYNELKKLVDTNNCFYISEQKYNDFIIHNFSYRLATYEDFNQNKYSRLCRGISFYKHISHNKWRILTASIPKFFNIGEGKDINQIKEEKILKIFDKIDGSLIHFGLLENKIIAKSKTSIFSEHAKKANQIFENNKNIQEFIKKEINNGFTPIFEFVSPDFRIVINYNTEELYYLCSINNKTMEIEFHDIPSKIRRPNTYSFNLEELLHFKENYNKLDKEGYVIYTNKDIYKIKSNKYVQVHSLKEDIFNNWKNFVKLVLNEEIDDIYSLFLDDQEIVKKIKEKEQIIVNIFNKKVMELIELYKKFKNMNYDRKKYAIKYKGHEIAYLVFKIKREEEKEFENIIKNYILNLTTKEKKIKEFIEKEVKLT